MATYREELQKLFDLQKFGIKLGLEGMRGILTRLGDPRRGMKFIHLAGTNGKGSVGVMLAKVLTVAGYKVGFYTSPHLVTFRERIKVDDRMISEDEVLAAAAKVWAVTDPDSPPTFFEFVTAMAFLHFQDMGVDLAIIETGLGGRLDSTNVIDPLVSVITNVSLEHTEHLGDTVEKIAWEKAGIIKAGKPVVIGQETGPALEVILRVAAENNSPALVRGRDFQVGSDSFDFLGRPTITFDMDLSHLEQVPLGLTGAHQADNAALVLAAIKLLAERGFTANEAQIRQGLGEASWPGRGEIFPDGSWPPFEPRGRVPLMLDGAHNPAGAKALAAMLEKLNPTCLHLVVGVMADKDIAGVLGPIIKMTGRLYLTRPEFSRAASPGLLWDKIAAAFGQPEMPTTLHLTIPDALAAAAREADEGDLVLLSGSLFTVGEGRAWLHGITEVESN